MPRIIAGLARGRQLAVAATGTRPTSDRVRSALFNTLETLIDFSGVRVLDLFAGTGAVGLEAASRGATTVTLVDSGRDAVLTLHRNVEVVGLPGVLIRPQRVESYLAGPAEQADLVFADPPYDYADEDLAALLQVLAGPGGWLAEDAVLVVERSRRSDPIRWPDVISSIKDKRYGDSVLSYGRRD